MTEEKTNVEPASYEDMSVESLTLLKEAINRKMTSLDKMITMFKSAKAHYQENVERIDGIIKNKQDKNE